MASQPSNGTGPLIALPPGYTVVADPAVGYSYKDAAGNIVFQNPTDSNAARQMVWQHYNRQKGTL